MEIFPSFSFVFLIGAYDINVSFRRVFSEGFHGAVFITVRWGSVRFFFPNRTAPYDFRLQLNRTAQQ